ncbi:hypothetical protein L3X38_009210 [Prunus dulcis]|uniref:Uncharacterized protein n=1 Tax=Prunus dulcis TaxID=3755 RepID=A0AAD5F7Z8_PRUDU|nr:hypothetical protein L3X38_009210 [Prunus dulcis]
MGINPKNPRSIFGVLAEESVLVTHFHRQKDIWVPLLEVHHLLLRRRELGREGLGEVGIELWVWGKSLGSLGDEEVRWDEKRAHLEGEKLTVTVILGGGVGG